MNRDVMQRQMFAKGGAAFPDLSGDGAVTQKDVLMGRGVLPMQGGGMAYPMQGGGMVYPMQEGGMTPVDPMATMPVAAQPTMPLDTDAMDLNSAAQGAMQQGIDPAVLEGMLGDYSSQMNSLDNAEDYETVMNGIRGDEMPIEARYSELAEIVGPEDAQATPESVLALVQPVMQLAAVDQGIGGLVEDEMNTPIVGPMADGIMSTVNLGAPEGADPVNFNQGGAVQYMAPGGVAEIVDPAEQVGGRQGEIFRQQQALFRSLRDPASDAADLEEQTNLTKAQMLFDISQGALNFATPGERRVSPAERLAQSFSPVLGNIGARAGELGKFKQAQTAQTKQLDMAAMKSAGSLYAAEQTAKNKTYAPQGAQLFTLGGDLVSAVPGTPRHANIINQGGLPTSALSASTVTNKTQYTVPEGDPLVIGNTTYAPGSSPFFSDLEVSQITSAFGNDALGAYVAPLTDKDYLTAYKMTKEQFENLPLENQQFLQGLPVITEKDYFDKFGMVKNDFLNLPPISRQRVLGIEPEYRFEKIDDGSGIDIVRIDENNPDVAPVSIYRTDVLQAPDLFKVNMLNEKGQMVATIIDLSIDSGKAALARVNKLNEERPGSASMQKIGTESFTSKAFLVPNSTTGGGSTVRMSFDGGQTYVGSDGITRQLPTDALELDPTQTYDVYRKEQIRSDAKNWLSENDSSLIAGMTAVNTIDGKVSSKTALPDADKKLVRDVMGQIRNGTGFWSGAFAGVNALGGGFFAPETFSTIFKETEDGRQYVQLIRVLGRSALASSPRFAIGDLETVQELFPNEANLFRNPVSESKKIIVLVEALNNEEIRLQKLRASDVPQDSAVLANASQKLQEIARLKELLGPVLTEGVTSATAYDITGAQDLMRSRLPASGEFTGLPTP